MRKLLPLLLIPASALAAPCLPTPALIALDSQYEEAMRSGNPAFLEALLADDFVWVHNLASAVENKAVIIARAKNPPAGYKARTTADVQAHVAGDTAVLRGVSVVEQWHADGKTWKTNRYQFMRTYVNVDGKCKLLSTQTMKVFSSEAK